MIVPLDFKRNKKLFFVTSRKIILHRFETNFFQYIFIQIFHDVMKNNSYLFLINLKKKPIYHFIIFFYKQFGTFPDETALIKINARLEPEVLDEDDEDANFVTVMMTAGGRKIGLIGIYAPNNDDAGFFKDKIANQMAKLVAKTDEQIIVGDFNVNLSKGIGYVKRKTYKSEALKNLTKAWNLADPVEAKARKAKIYPVTYIHTIRNEDENKDKFPLKAARIDGIFTTLDLSKCDIKLGRFFPSDHASIRMEFQNRKKGLETKCECPQE